MFIRLVDPAVRLQIANNWIAFPYPSISQHTGGPMVATYYLGLVFGLSILGYRRNMAEGHLHAPYV